MLCISYEIKDVKEVSVEHYNQIFRYGIKFEAYTSLSPKINNNYRHVIKRAPATFYPICGDLIVVLV